MASELTEPSLHPTPAYPLYRLPSSNVSCPQIWSMKKDSEAATKKKPKVNAAQLRVQKGTYIPTFPRSLSLGA